MSSYRNGETESGTPKRLRLETARAKSSVQRCFSSSFDKEVIHLFSAQ